MRQAGIYMDRKMELFLQDETLKWMLGNVKLGTAFKK
jgi:hypothetical protein